MALLNAIDSRLKVISLMYLCKIFLYCICSSGSFGDFFSIISLKSNIVLQILFMNLLEESIPASVQKISLSGGESERTNHLAVSAP